MAQLDKKGSEEFTEKHADLNKVSLPDDAFTQEWKWARIIPGYSPKRCLKLQGRAMTACVLSYAGLCILFFGYDASVMSQVNTNTDYLKTMGAAGGTDRDAAAVGGIVSSWFLGFLIGALMTGSYADRVGRIRSMWIGTLFGILGAALQASSQNIVWMIFGRIINGMGCSHLNTITPVWTSELADPSVRGAFVGVQFTLAICGSTLVYWIEYGLTQTTSAGFAWRFPIALQCVFLVAIACTAPFMPESLRHLVKTNRMQEARQIMRQCRIHPDEEAMERELNGIALSIKLEARDANKSYWDILTHSDKFHTRRRILLGAGVQIMQKLTGIDFIAAFAPTTFSLSGFSPNQSALLAGGNFISCNFADTFSLALSIYLVDRVGRRRLMLYGSSILAVVLIIGGVLSHEVTAQPDKAKKFGSGVAAMLYIFTFAYGATWLTVCWLMPTEIFPLAFRAKGVALSVVAFSLAGGLINEIIPYLIKAIDFWTLILFGLVNAAMLVPIWLFYCETMNRNLEDLNVLFSSPSPLNYKAERYFAEHTDAQGRHISTMSDAADLKV